MSQAQCADAVLMIRPAAFDYNPETAITNSMQQRPGMVGVPAHNDLARAEFQHMVNALQGEGVRVCVVDDTPQPPKPDAIFPNNWVSFHADGTVVLYPMMAPNRRLERRLDVIESLDMRDGFRISRTIDLTYREAENKFLEGTGSLVLDRKQRVAYACLSPRTDMDVLGEFAQRLDYEIVAFEAFDAEGAPIYHTNVLMSVGDGFAAVCVDCIEPTRREAVTGILNASGRSVIELTLE